MYSDDKQQGSFNAVTTTTAVKQDLVILPEIKKPPPLLNEVQRFFMTG